MARTAATLIKRTFTFIQLGLAVLLQSADTALSLSSSDRRGCYSPLVKDTQRAQALKQRHVADGDQHLPDVEDYLQQRRPILVLAELDVGCQNTAICHFFINFLGIIDQISHGSAVAHINKAHDTHDIHSVAVLNHK